MTRPLDLTVEELTRFMPRSMAEWAVDGIDALIESKRLANADRYSTGRVVPGVAGVPNDMSKVDPHDFSGGG